MSVLIKGMELPAECRECKMLTYYSTSGCSMCDITGNALARNFKPIPFDGRPDWCPLIEIPEHGRLIDADALKETLDYYICEANWGDEVNKALRWVKDEFINSENTVIEAEGSENHDD